jgi:GNAT superfamily N-acetyltransferase
VSVQTPLSGRLTFLRDAAPPELSTHLTAEEAVQWTAPTKPHVSQLQQFTCCEPEIKTKPYKQWKHSTPWRLHAQNLLRNMPVPCRPPDFGVIGVDDRGIAAAAWFQIDGGVWHINAVGVALRWQSRRLGDKLMERVLSRIIEHAEEHHVTVSQVTGRIHPENRQSIAMVTRWGFVQIPESDRDEDVYPLWGMALPTRL